jgi:hypothetical protein
MSRHQIEGQNHDIKIANRTFENAENSRYLGTTITNTNLINEEIEIRLISCLLPFSSESLSSRLLSKNVKLQLPVLLNGCETWSLALREEHRLRVFENRVLR